MKGKILPVVGGSVVATYPLHLKIYLDMSCSIAFLENSLSRIPLNTRFTTNTHKHRLLTNKFRLVDPCLPDPVSAVT